MITIQLADTTVKLETMWRTREGYTIPLSKMDDNHLANSINLLERQRSEAETNRVGRSPDITEHNIKVLQNEMLRRGEL